MTKDELIAMARDAGLEVSAHLMERAMPGESLLEERLRRLIEAAQAQEREACASLCDSLRSNDYCVDVRQAAAAIRARPN